MRLWKKRRGSRPGKRRYVTLYIPEAWLGYRTLCQSPRAPWGDLYPRREIGLLDHYRRPDLPDLLVFLILFRIGQGIKGIAIIVDHFVWIAQNSFAFLLHLSKHLHTILLG